ncbi:MAG: cyclic nucleotide-binding domain-containing protein [Gammaproteobacteria bacterium]|nr:cyclic nucleotide-binding domain-containing protein [Gammaproteobacteria bacterium]
MNARGILQKLVPLNTLSDSGLDEAIAATQIDQTEEDTVLFREGEDDGYAVYLLQGEIALTSENQSEPRKIRSSTDASRYAIAQLKPRLMTGTTTKPSTIARIDQNILDHIVTMDEVSGIEIIEMDTGEDVRWVFNILSSNTFRKLPPANANQMLARMENVPVKANQIIINQGDPGDYYYLIREGVASVAKKNDDGKTDIVSELSVGDQFGEEALLSDTPRNATVMMKTDGILMRLTREDFNELLTEPMLHWAEQAEANALIGEGAGILDVRTVDEYRSGAINNSLNIPLSQIRQFSEHLDRTRKYVIYCQTGSRSSVATFMLNQRGFNTVALKGGLMALTLIPQDEKE